MASWPDYPGNYEPQMDWMPPEINHNPYNVPDDDWTPPSAPVAIKNVNAHMIPVQGTSQQQRMRQPVSGRQARHRKITTTRQNAVKNRKTKTKPVNKGKKSKYDEFKRWTHPGPDCPKEDSLPVRDQSDLIDRLKQIELLSETVQKYTRQESEKQTEEVGQESQLVVDEVLNNEGEELPVDKHKLTNKPKEEAALFSYNFFKNYSSLYSSAERQRAFDIEYEDVCKHLAGLKAWVPYFGTNSDEAAKHEEWRKLPTKIKREDAVIFDKYLILMCLAVNRKAQKDAEVYCLRFAAKYNYDVENKKQISEKNLMTMREKEYKKFRLHADGMIASARQSEAVSNAEDKEDRFRVWKNLPALPEERNDELFDSYIPLARLVAEMKHQRNARKKSNAEWNANLADNDKKLKNFCAEVSRRLTTLRTVIEPNDELDQVIARMEQFWKTFTSVMDKKEPTISDLMNAIAKSVKNDLQRQIKNKERKTGKILTQAQIQKMISNSKASILGRCRNKMVEYTFDVYYPLVERVLAYINLIKPEELMPSPVKSQRSEEPIEEDTSDFIQLPNATPTQYSQDYTLPSTETFFDLSGMQTTSGHLDLLSSGLGYGNRYSDEETANEESSVSGNPAPERPLAMMVNATNLPYNVTEFDSPLLNTQATSSGINRREEQRELDENLDEDNDMTDEDCNAWFNMSSAESDKQFSDAVSYCFSSHS